MAGAWTKGIAVKKFAALIAVSLSFASAAPAHAVEFITNGNFSGGLTGWTNFVTTNGIANQTTSNFNVTGSGANTALRMRVGQVIWQGATSTPRGGGVYQMVNLTYAALYTFKADYATNSPGNSSGGVFSLMINDAAVTNFNTGSVFGTERGTLTYAVNLAPGLYKIGVQVARPYTSTSSATQYFDNITFSAPAPVGYAPEPGTWALMLTGFGLSGWMMRRNRQALRVRFL